MYPINKVLAVTNKLYRQVPNNFWGKHFTIHTEPYSKKTINSFPLLTYVNSLNSNPDPSKTPLVLVACGSYSPLTYLHLRMFEMAQDFIADTPEFEIIGGYFSPVSDAYDKPGLAAWEHRVEMCELAVEGSGWLMVDHWEGTDEWPKAISEMDMIYGCGAMMGLIFLSYK